MYVDVCMFTMYECYVSMLYLQMYDNKYDLFILFNANWMENL